MKRASLIAAVLLLGCAPGADSGGSGPGESPPPAIPPQGRLVEEGDLVKVAGTRLYTLSSTRLLVVELGNPAAPRLAAAAPLSGTPREMYHLRTGWIAVVLAAPRGMSTSEVSIFDGRDPARLELRARVLVDGEITDSRLVGDVLYVVSNDGARVASIGLHDPAHPVALDVVTFPAGSQNHVLMTDTTFFLAMTSQSDKTGQLGECQGPGAPGFEWRYPCTRITALDTSDPAGHMVVGATVYLTGYLLDRFGLDHHEGVLRVMLGTWHRGTSREPARLRTLRAPDAYHLDPLGSTTITTARPESLTSVRFDGPRGFAVTFEQRDPLFTLDLSAPDKPRVVGHLESPGWVDYLAPLGDRLIGVGHDRVEDVDPWKLHASLYDVSNLAQPKLLDRKLFGNAPTQALADERDNWAKVVRVLPALGLVIVPFNARSYTSQSATGQLQLLGLEREGLRLGGLVAQSAPIQRAVALGPGVVVAISNRALEVLDVSDLANPRVLGVLANDVAVMAGVMP